MAQEKDMNADDYDVDHRDRIGRDEEAVDQERGAPRQTDQPEMQDRRPCQRDDYQERAQISDELGRREVHDSMLRVAERTTCLAGSSSSLGAVLSIFPVALRRGGKLPWRGTRPQI